MLGSLCVFDCVWQKIREPRRGLFPLSRPNPPPVFPEKKGTRGGQRVTCHDNVWGAFTDLQVVRRYYATRLRRMLPSYYATLAFVRFAFLPTLGLPNARAPEALRAIQTLWFNERDGCPDKLWANFLFVNNQLQRAGCMKYAWSQAVQVSAAHHAACLFEDRHDMHFAQPLSVLSYF